MFKQLWRSFLRFSYAALAAAIIAYVIELAILNANPTSDPNINHEAIGIAAILSGFIALHPLFIVAFIISFIILLILFNRRRDLKDLF